jgi:hypothetical protein
MLDKDKPFSTVHGQTIARYKQNGVYYDINGQRIEKDQDDGQKGEYRDLDWRTLQALVKEKGGKWTNKQDAIDYLESL